MRISDWSSDVCSSDLKTIPTILTTSQKLSTGVDARNVRNIVLMRPVNSMIEFKQIIGRGTRLYDGKDYFTIHDFEGAYQHFLDPEWAGEPVDPEPAGSGGTREKRSRWQPRSEENTSEIQSLMRISYDVLCLYNKQTTQQTKH